MAQEKTSLEKSHSAWSNTKLTLLCFVTIIAVTAFWGALALINILPTPLFIALLVASGIASGVCVMLFNKFKR